MLFYNRTDDQTTRCRRFEASVAAETQFIVDLKLTEV